MSPHKKIIAVKCMWEYYIIHKKVNHLLSFSYNAFPMTVEQWNSAFFRGNLSCLRCLVECCWDRLSGWLQNCENREKSGNSTDLEKSGNFEKSNVWEFLALETLAREGNIASSTSLTRNFQLIKWFIVKSL